MSPSHPSLRDSSHIRLRDISVPGCHHSPQSSCHCVLHHLFCAGEVQAFYEDLSGRQYVNEVFNFSVDKLYDLLFTTSPFLRDFMEQRRFSGLISELVSP